MRKWLIARLQEGWLYMLVTVLILVVVTALAMWSLPYLGAAFV